MRRKGRDDAAFMSRVKINNVKQTSSKKSRLALFACGFLCLYFVKNFSSQLGMVSVAEHRPVTWNNIAPRNSYSKKHRAQQGARLLQLRTRPGWQTSSDGAFVHMGKTGGSSLSLLLRNGCHSFKPKPCRTVPNETIASLRIGTYYHVPDFGLIPHAKHSFYIITLRDPFPRSISAFVYEHIDNELARGETLTPLTIEAKTEAKKCFPSLEKFVEWIGDDVDHYNYPYHRSQIVATDCTSLARAVMNGRVRRFNHFFFTFQKVRSLISDQNNPIIFATRQEFLSYDWKKINYLLGQQGDVVVPNEAARNITGVYQPVSHDLGDVGKQRLCKALQREYESYVRILREAINLSDEDVMYSLDKIRRTCPNVIIPS